MPGENESVFVAEGQSLDVDEQKKNNILSFIESCNDLQDFIKRLEKENLIWYFIGPLLQDKDVRGQVSSKWKTDFQEFEQSIGETHRKFEKLLPGQSFLAYSTRDDDFNIRFEEEKPIKISDILRASNKDEVYNIFLGKDNQVTACKKNGNERHYDFAGSGSCKMTVNWQAKDSKGNSVNCSMTVKVDSSGIRSVIGEPKFGSLKFTDPLPEETKNEILELVEQNKEVFINGKTLYQAFVDMGKSIDNQQIPKEGILTRDPSVSPRSLTPDSNGYFSPGSTSTSSSRRGSLSTNSEDETFESGTSDDEEVRRQGEGLGDEIEELKSKIEELERENELLKKQNAELESRNKKITEEGDKKVSELTEKNQALEKEFVRLKVELERETKELAGKDQKIEQLKQEVGILEQSQRDKNARIAELKDRLEGEKSKTQSTDKVNEELRKKLKQSETELSVLKEENVRLKNDVKEIGASLKGNYEKQLAELLSEREKKLTDAISQLNEEQLKNRELAEELNQLQKEKEALEEATHQSSISGGSLADELNEGNMQSEIETLQRQLKEKEDMLTHTQEELKSVKESLEQLQNILQQEESQRETAAASTQTEVERDDEEIRASIQQGDVSRTQNRGTREAQPQNIMDWPVPKGLDFLQPEKTVDSHHIQNKKSTTATSSAQTILTSDDGRDFFDKKQNIAGAELKPLPPETKLSSTKLTPNGPKKSRS